MKEVKPSKKPLAIYYAIVLLVLLVINLVVMPWLAERGCCRGYPVQPDHFYR